MSRLFPPMFGVYNLWILMQHKYFYYYKVKIPDSSNEAKITYREQEYKLRCKEFSSRDSFLCSLCLH